MADSLSSTLTLHDGVVMPWFGLGCSKIYAGPTGDKDPVSAALQEGYRLIDTAQLYKNQAEVGVAVRDSGIPREDIFVVSKLIDADHGKTEAALGVEKSLNELGLEYIDLYLIHSPGGFRLVETYKILLKYKERGLLRSVGVSNFDIQHLEGLKAAGLPAPSVNQIELHPWQYQKKKALVDYCIKHGIAVMGYRPLVKQDKPDDPTVLSIANKYKKTWAQVLIRWSLQKRFITIPRSSSPDRIKENADVFDFQLSDEEMETLDGFPTYHCARDPTETPFVD